MSSKKTKGDQKRPGRDKFESRENARGRNLPDKDTNKAAFKRDVASKASGSGFGASGQGQSSMISTGASTQYFDSSQYGDPNASSTTASGFYESGQGQGSMLSTGASTGHYEGSSQYPAGAIQGEIPDYQDTYVEYQQPQQSHSSQIGQSHSAIPQVAHSFGSYAQQSGPAQSHLQHGYSSSPQFGQGPAPNYQDTYVGYQQPQQTYSSQMGQSYPQIPQVPHTYNPYLHQQGPAQSHLQQASGSYSSPGSPGSPLEFTATETRPLPATFVPKRPTHKQDPDKGPAVAWIQLDANGSEWVYKDPMYPSKIGRFVVVEPYWTGLVDKVQDVEDVCEKFGINARFRDSSLSPCGIHQVKSGNETFHVYWAFWEEKTGQSTKAGSSKTAHTRSSSGRDSRHQSERRGSHSSRAGGTPREHRRKDSDSPFGFTETLGNDHPNNPNNPSRRNDKSGDKGKEKSHR